MKLNFALFTLIFTLSCFSFAGHSVNNGGDAIAAAFIKEARSLLFTLDKSVVKRTHGAMLRKLRTAVNTTKVNSANTVEIDGVEYDAVNFPAEKRIVISITRWNLKTKKSALVLHEYLWIAGYDDSNYSISQWLVNNKDNRNPEPILIPIW